MWIFGPQATLEPPRPQSYSATVSQALLPLISLSPSAAITRRVPVAFFACLACVLGFHSSPSALYLPRRLCFDFFAFRILLVLAVVVVVAVVLGLFSANLGVLIPAPAFDVVTTVVVVLVAVVVALWEYIGVGVGVGVGVVVVVVVVEITVVEY